MRPVIIQNVTEDPFALPAFVISIVSLVIATIGALTGLVALVWQIITRTRGAHRVRVLAHPGMMIHTAGGNSSAGPYIQIQVTNRGAAAVQVQSWGVLLPGGNALMVVIPEEFPPAPSLPLWLQPGSNVSFYSLASNLMESIELDLIARARVFVILGTGQRVIGRRGELAPRARAKS